MKTEPIQLNGHCYVLMQGDWYHPIIKHRHDIVWYPESAMTLTERHQYRPYVRSVVTEDAWIIACYPMEKVRVLDDETGAWTWPDRQTYGASHNHITCCLLGIRSTIPAVTLDGGVEIKKHIAEYKKLIDKAHKLYKV